MKAMLVGLAACVIASASAWQARAAFRYDDLWNHGVPLRDYRAASAPNSEPSVYDEMLIDNGVDPASDKGQLILAWIARIDDDPVVTGSARGVSQLFLNAGARAELMADGLERLSPALRLQYVMLITRLLDTLVPADCFGLNAMDAVVNRVSLSAMSEADIDGYFRLLLAALQAAQSETSPELPSPQQSERAEESLKRSLLHELGYVQSNVARYIAYSGNPEGATPVDACWAMRVTMHAILAMPDPDRDVVLRQTVQSQRATSAPRQ